MSVVDAVKAWWRSRKCPHLRRRPVFGDERRYGMFCCQDCGRMVG